MDLVHRLDGIVEQEPRQAWIDGKVERKEERQRRGVKVARAQHRAGRPSLLVTSAVCSRELCNKPALTRVRGAERRHERLLGSQPHEQVLPDSVEGVVEYSANDRPSCLFGVALKVPQPVAAFLDRVEPILPLAQRGLDNSDPAFELALFLRM